MNTNTNRVYTARIPYVLDDTTLDDIRAAIASFPSVLEIVRDDDPPHSSADSDAFVVTTTNPSALRADVAAAFNDDDYDASEPDTSRVAFLD